MSAIINRRKIIDRPHVGSPVEDWVFALDVLADYDDGTPGVVRVSLTQDAYEHYTLDELAEMYKQLIEEELAC